MIGKEIYKIYAPNGTKWTEWIRPVPFVAIDTYNRKPIFLPVMLLHKRAFLKRREYF